MAKLKSFEQYVTEMGRAEEIEQEIEDMGTPEPKTPQEVEDEAEEVQESEKNEESGEEEDEESEEEESIPVSEMLENCYASVKEEAKVWESDAHDDHTIETYMVENAALVASLSANTLKEMKEESSTEAFEACLNQMVEAYTKKMNEAKDFYNAPEGSEGEIE